MPDPGNILVILRKEVRDAARNRWFLLYTLAFVGLSLGLAGFGLRAFGSSGLSNFGRTSASMVNLVLLIVPLMGLTIGAMSMAGERERGSLLYLLSQPLDHSELLLGKYFGLAFGLLASLVIGFGLSGVLIMMANGLSQLGTYVNLVLYAFLLGLGCLSIGFLISIVARSGAAAIGAAVFLWLVLVLFGDLGMMGTAIVMDLKPETLFTITLINPLQIFKISSLLNIENNLEVLGPAGIYALRTYGVQLLPGLLGALLLWAWMPLIATLHIFRKRGGL